MVLEMKCLSTANANLYICKYNYSLMIMKMWFELEMGIVLLIIGLSCGHVTLIDVLYVLSIIFIQVLNLAFYPKIVVMLSKFL